MGWLGAWRDRARLLRSETVALYLAARDPRTPRAAMLVALAIVAYVLSPIDLIPDFIPVIGLLDDIVLVPIAIRFAVRLIPPAALADARARAPAVIARGKRLALAGAVVVVAVWIAIAVFLWYAIRALMSPAV